MRVFPRRFLIVLMVALSIVALSWFMWPAAQLAESTDLGASAPSDSGYSHQDESAVTAGDAQHSPASLSAMSSPAISEYLGALRPTLAADVPQMRDWPRYDLRLRIDPLTRQVLGTQQVIYTNRERSPMKDLALRLYPNTEYMEGQMTLGDVRVNQRVATTRFVVRNGRIDRSMVLLRLPSSLAPGAQLTLTLALTVTAPLSPTNGYRTLGLIDGMLSLPNAYAMIALRERGKWRLDSTPTFGDVVLSEMALYRARIELPKNYMLVATGVCQPDGDAQMCISGPARDFAMHVSAQYRMRSAMLRDGTDGDITIYSYYLPEHERTGVRALDYAATALKIYERRFGTYPYRELKIFETATIAGGIEYPMLAGVSSVNYEFEGGYFEWLIAHEIAHQWWYNMVGSNPMTEAWLDEALTQYSASLYIEDRYGDAIARTQRNLFFSERYDQERKAKGDRRVGQPSEEFPRWSYFPIVYGKGPLFFEQVRRNGDDARFEAWLRTYFAHNRYGIAQADDLLKAATDVGLGDIARVAYEQWIVGRTSGSGKSTS